MLAGSGDEIVDEAQKSPRLPPGNLVPRAHVTRPLVSFNNLTSRISGQAAKYDSKWRRAMLNFGPLWRGISVGSDALYKLKPRSVTQLSVIFLLAISKTTPFLE